MRSTKRRKVPGSSSPAVVHSRLAVGPFAVGLVAVASVAVVAVVTVAEVAFVVAFVQAPYCPVGVLEHSCTPAGLVEALVPAAPHIAASVPSAFAVELAFVETDQDVGTFADPALDCQVALHAAFLVPFEDAAVVMLVVVAAAAEQALYLSEAWRALR